MKNTLLNHLLIIAIITTTIVVTLSCDLSGGDTIGKPILQTPANSSTITSTAPTLVWQAVSGAAKYQLVLDDNTDFSSTVVDDNTIIDTSYSLSGFAPEILSNETTYYWKVRARDSEDLWGPWSDRWSFSVNLGTVILLYPANGVSINDTTPTLTWNVNTTTSRYHIMIDEDISFTTPVVNRREVTSISYTLLGTGVEILTDGGMYYWKVAPMDGYGVEGSFSEVWNFTVDTSIPTGSISINNGDNNTHNRSVTLSLSADDGTGGGIYQMIISNNSDFSGSSWENYTTTKTWIMGTGAGNKTVYIKFSDNAGNESIVHSDTIYFDPNVYVSTGGDDGNEGFAGSPLLTLTAGINMAVTQGIAPCEVRVAGSTTVETYTENSGIDMAAGVSLMGGYNGDFSVRNSGTYVSKITSTNEYTIKCDGAAITDDTKIGGFTITNTKSFGENVYTIYCSNEAKPIISNNVINNEGENNETITENNAATACIYCNNANPIIEYNEINGGSGNALNSPRSAGSAGIYSNNSSLTIRNNSAICGGSGISNDIMNAGSVGIYFIGSSNSIISNNELIYGGSGSAESGYSAGSAGIYCQYWTSYYCSITISYNTLIDGGSGNMNNAQGVGSTGVYCLGSPAEIIISNNTEINGGIGTANYSSVVAGSAGIYFFGDFEPIVTENILIHGGSGSASGGYSVGSTGIFCLANVYGDNYSSPIIYNNLEINGGNGNVNGIYSTGSAGLFNISSSFTIQNNLIIGGTGSAVGNISSGSTGIFCYNNYGGMYPIIKNNYIRGGTGTSDSIGSTGIYSMGSSSNPVESSIINNIIKGEDGDATNSPFIDSSGIFCYNKTYSIIANNILIADASTHEFATGVYLLYSEQKISNNIIYTIGGSNRYGIFEDGVDNDPTTVQNNLIFDCPSGLYYDEGTTAITSINDVNALTECQGNITTTQTLTELFVAGDPFDFHLIGGSDAIDAGIDTSGTYWGEVLDDIDGEARPKGSAYDIGADEY